MRNETRVLYNAFTQQLGQLNGVPDVSKKFNVEPTVEQKLETRIQESSSFLSRVNVYGVREQEGEKVGLDIDSPTASTTDTEKQARQTSDPTGLDQRRYRCEQTNFDTHIRYQKLDAWAKFPDFQTRIRNLIVHNQALARIMIGWNGTARAATSNKVKNPLLQDVNIGWLEKMRTENAARVMKEGKEGSGKIIVGENGDYKNLDALVFDMVEEFIHPLFQEDTRLVAICGRKLLADKYFPIINQQHAPSEMLAADVVTSQKRLGNLPAVRVPYFPADGLLITPLENLSIYWQLETRRRTLVDHAARDRIENYESVNEAYVIEELAAACLVENIQVKD